MRREPQYVWNPACENGLEEWKAKNNYSETVVGEFNSDGEGVPQDYKEAVKWYRNSADVGDASAMYTLGVCYDNGEGVPQDYKEAVKWYRKAADLCNATAMVNLGFCYEDSLGVPQDYIMAHMLYNVGFAHGEKLGSENRDRLARIMTPAQIQRAEDMASKKIQEFKDLK